jgi:putative transposase
MKQIKNRSKWLSAYDLHELTSGCSAELGIHAHTVQKVCTEYATRRKQFKKFKLNWRSKKKSLGWIPFKANGIKIVDDVAIYCKQRFKLWLSRPIEGTIKKGSFNQDSRGRWYINLQCEVEDSINPGSQNIGIDLGLKDQLTLSNGIKYHRENLTKAYEDRLAMAQRANKKRLAKAIHTKISNCRKDWAHKTTTEIVKTAKSLYVGDVASKKLAKTKLAKSVYDAGWRQIKSLLKYKSIRIGADYRDTNEKFSTVTCSVCGSRSGPSGLSGLGVRQWSCNSCGTGHDRDVNAARNILIVGLGHQTPLKGILCL